MLTPVNQSFTIQKWGPRGYKLHGHLSIPVFSDVQTIDTCQAAFLPIGASVSLLVMFLFFDSLQMVFAICTAGKNTDAIFNTR